MPASHPLTVRGGPIVALPTAFGEFRAQAWIDESTGIEHLSVSAAIPAAPPTGTDTRTRAPEAAPGEAVHPAPLVRLHSECLTGDVFGSYRCDCGEQLAYALGLIHEQGGALLYLRGHEGRGIGLANKLRAYALQEAGADTVDANEQLGLPVDGRDYAAAAAILAAMGLHSIRLMTNNPVKEDQLAALGINVLETVRTEVPSRTQNVRYLQTKRDRMNHNLSLLELPGAGRTPPPEANPAPIPTPLPGTKGKPT